jgi:hypothetical protein
MIAIDRQPERAAGPEHVACRLVACEHGDEFLLQVDNRLTADT